MKYHSMRRLSQAIEERQPHLMLPEKDFTPDTYGDQLFSNCSWSFAHENPLRLAPEENNNKGQSILLQKAFIDIDQVVHVCHFAFYFNKNTKLQYYCKKRTDHE